MTIHAVHGAPSEPVRADQLRAVLRRLVSGVTVLTTEHDGRPWGMTVSAFTPVSLEPPLALVCVNRATATATHIIEQQRVGINVLSSDQAEISGRCAEPGTPKFLDPSDLGDWVPGWNTPRIAGSLASFDTTVESFIEAGTHVVVIVRVWNVATASEGDPLLYGGGQYLDISSINRVTRPTQHQPGART
ncbi:MAG: flavin reductase family protein [Ilumatobacteraceae bacterium]